jgi:hypothetical protein
MNNYEKNTFLWLNNTCKITIDLLLLKKKKLFFVDHNKIG